ncbi:hypothetical protein AK812_SmicGene15592 [Symbiodinium microadriaticum]|uniref:Uncharacterized protein n=1 Tax=Symbiodinium microadriaticum TaxID=2951 RepID=A0A1Q9E2H8_SYMMI|nr:hypothetical protein AK812_SmicGene15592 [Symbiodinium microadriaticum]
MEVSRKSALAGLEQINDSVTIKSETSCPGGMLTSKSHPHYAETVVRWRDIVEPPGKGKAAASRYCRLSRLHRDFCRLLVNILKASKFGGDRVVTGSIDAETVPGTESHDVLNNINVRREVEPTADTLKSNTAQIAPPGSPRHTTRDESVVNYEPNRGEMAMLRKSNEMDSGRVRLWVEKNNTPPTTVVGMSLKNPQRGNVLGLLIPDFVTLCT